MKNFILLYEQDFYSWSDQVIPVFGYPDYIYEHEPVITKEDFDCCFENLKDIENPKRRPKKVSLEKALKHYLWWDKRQKDYVPNTRSKIKLLKILRKDIKHNPHIKIYLDDWVFEVIPLHILKHNLITTLKDTPRKNPY